MGWDWTPGVAARTIAQPPETSSTCDLSVCKVGTFLGCALEAVFGCLLINSLENTMRGDADALKNLEIKQHPFEIILVSEVI